MTDTATTTSGTELTKFFDGHEIRVVEQDDEVWLVASDICDVLEIDKVSRNVRGRIRKNTDGRRYRTGGLDDDEWTTPNGSTNSPHLRHDQLLVNQFGVYQLILKSKVKDAKRMKRWLTHEVIPSIQTTGSYQMQEQSAGISPELQETMQQTQQMLQQLVAATASTHQTAAEAKQVAEEAREEMRETLESRSVASDIEERTWQSMRDEIEALRLQAMKEDDTKDHVKYWGFLYDDLRRHYKLNIDQLIRDRSHTGSKIQCLTREEMRLALDSARHIFA